MRSSATAQWHYNVIFHKLTEYYFIALHNHSSYEGLARIMSPYSILWLSVSTILAFSCTALQVLEEGQSRDLEERTSKPLPAPAQGLAMT